MDKSKDRIAKLVYQAVDEINEDLPPTVKLAKDPGTVLFGAGASIDSIILVSIIVAVEEQLLEEYGISATLASEKAMSMEHSPFKTLGTMIEYVYDVAEKEWDG